MPVRRIGLCYRSVGGRVPMGRGKPMVRVESTLERDFALLQKFDPAVLSLEEQPVRIAFHSADGKNRSYVPDFLVRYRDAASAPRLVEVKYATDPDLASGAMDERFAAAKTYASTQGWSFELVTDADIRTLYLANATFLLLYRTRMIDPDITGQLFAALRHGGPQSVRSLVDDVAQVIGTGAETVLAAVWALVARFQLQANLHQPLSMNSQIQLPQEDKP